MGSFVTHSTSMHLVTPGKLDGMELDFLPEHTLVFRHRIFYSNQHAVPAVEIADALLALDRLVQRIPNVMRLAVPRTPKIKARLYVEQVESGSLQEDIIVALGFGSKEEMDTTLAMWRKKLGIDLKTRAGVIRAILYGLVAIGVYHAIGVGVQKVFSPTPEQKAQMEVSHNTIIQIGAGELQMTPEQFSAVLKAVPNQNKNAADAVRFIAPAKRDAKADIVIDGDATVSFPTDYIAATPTDFQPPDTSDFNVANDVAIELRALDLDSTSSGWAAVIPSISPRRVKLELAETIKPADLFGRKFITGDVEITSKKNKAGQPDVRGYRLIQVQNPQDQ